MAVDVLPAMANSPRSNSLSALTEGQPDFSAGTGRFTIGITNQEGIHSGKEQGSANRPLGR